MLKTNLLSVAVTLGLIVPGSMVLAQATATDELVQTPTVTDEQQAVDDQAVTGADAPATDAPAASEAPVAETEAEVTEEAPAADEAAEATEEEPAAEEAAEATEEAETAEPEEAEAAETEEAEAEAHDEAAEAEHATEEGDHAATAEGDDHGGDAHATPHIENIDFSFDGPFGAYDVNQLQRGLQIYTEVCSACHGLQYVALRTLGDEGGPHLPEDQVIEYAKGFDVFDADLDDTRPATPVDHFPRSALSNAPDLSLMAKKRAAFHGPYGLGINQFMKGIGGPEYITALLTGYTGEEKEQAGTVLYENTVFPGGWISMAPPLADEQVEFVDGHANDLHHMSEDVSAFLMWTAEPKLGARKQAGFAGVLLLTLLSVLLYLTNKKLWAPVKYRKES
tara:strand:+ start:113036 stop:114217 length:1182 start_codon:yes stop_codon:yes gene_type:complete